MASLFFHHRTNLLLTKTDRKQSKQRANGRTNAKQFTKHTKSHIVGMLRLNEAINVSVSHIQYVNSDKVGKLVQYFWN